MPVRSSPTNYWGKTLLLGNLIEMLLLILAFSASSSVDKSLNATKSAVSLIGKASHNANLLA